MGGGLGGMMMKTGVATSGILTRGTVWMEMEA